MNLALTDINWLAVIVATIAYSAFSGIWHRQFAFGEKSGKTQWVSAIAPKTSGCFIVGITAFVKVTAVANLIPVSSHNVNASSGHCN